MKLKRSSTLKKSVQVLLRIMLKGGDRQGFTLIELLVSMLIASLIVSGLLYGVVEILQTNQKDSSRSDTQRDMQMAMDYIARDVREATYVYGVMPDPADPTKKESCLSAYGNGRERGRSGQCTGLLEYLPANLNKLIENKDFKGNTPVLAFWKPEPLPSNVRAECKSKADQVGTGNVALDRIPCVAQRMYTLVIYSINTEPATSFSWRGKARITRYQLPHFTEGSLNIANGWAAPVAKDKRPLTWPIGDTATRSGENLQENGPITGNTQTNFVLTDFVDNDPTTYNPKYCPNGFDAPSGYEKNAISTKFNRAFYVCLRSGALTALDPSDPLSIATNTAAAAGQGINPEVHIVIRGNAAGRGGISKDTGEVPFQMETRVLSRGVYGKLSN
jgi:prepilin-type N-terminal cleavage/methylation domain-containing protein